MKKIRLIIPYFGKLPKFFPYFLLTAKRNQKIDFLIYTDQKVDQFTILNANNIEFVTLSFDELREKVQSKFDFKISLKTPYKLCDYKVAYGLIFEEELKGGGSVKSTFLADIEKLFQGAMQADGIEGVILNPWNRTLMLDKSLIRIVPGSR